MQITWVRKPGSTGLVDRSSAVTSRDRSSVTGRPVRRGAPSFSVPLALAAPSHGSRYLRCPTRRWPIDPHKALSKSAREAKPGISPSQQDQPSAAVPQKSPFCDFWWVQHESCGFFFFVSKPRMKLAGWSGTLSPFCLILLVDLSGEVWSQPMSWDSCQSMRT